MATYFGQYLQGFFLLLAVNLIESVTITNTGCGSSKTCAAVSTHCLTGSLGSCRAFAAWRGIAVNGVNYLEVELYGTSTSSNFYVGIAYSTDTSMPNNPFEACLVHGSGTVQVKYGRFTARSFPGFATSPAATVFLVTSGGNLGLQYSSRTLQCRYRRRLMSSNAAVGLNTSTPYYTLVATGTTNTNGTVLNYHSNRTVSNTSSSIRISNETSSTNTNSPRTNTSSPTTNTSRPTDNTGTSSGNTTRPSNNTGSPSGNTTRPSNNTGSPSRSTSRPSVNTRRPPPTTRSPSSNTRSPARTSARPSSRAPVVRTSPRSLSTIQPTTTSNTTDSNSAGTWAVPYSKLAYLLLSLIYILLN